MAVGIHDGCIERAVGVGELTLAGQFAFSGHVHEKKTVSEHVEIA